jgi:hypothetical protein
VGLIEYRIPAGRKPQLWRVTESESLAAEFACEVTPELMTQFHGVVSPYARGWMICRRLFGIGPVIVPRDANPDDLRVWRRPELQEALGIDAGQLKAELEAVRSVWDRYRGRRQRTAEEQKAGDKGERAPGGASQAEFGDGEQLVFGPDILPRYGFEPAIFELPSRGEDETEREKQWFAQRVGEWRRMLVEPMASTLAKQALLNELHLRRVELQLCRLTPGGKEFRELEKTKREIEETYQGQLAMLDEVFPWKSSIGGKMSFRGCLSDLVRAVRDYRANGSTELVDQIRTVSEVEVELRQSVQAPEPRYRWGLNMAILESQQWMFDPRFQSQLRPQTLAKLNLIWREAVERARQALGEDLVDLEKDGEEYPDLKAEG